MISLLRKSQPYCVIHFEKDHFTCNVTQILQISSHHPCGLISILLILCGQKLTNQTYESYFLNEGPVQLCHKLSEGR